MYFDHTLEGRERGDGDCWEICHVGGHWSVVDCRMFWSFLLTKGRVGVEPRYMGISPIYAVPKALAQAGLSKDDVDVYEVRKLLWMIFSISLNISLFLQINEAFASQFAYCVEQLGIHIEKINPK